MSTRCIICGRLINQEEDEPKKSMWDDEDDFIPKPKKKVSSFCQFCEAKLRKEADDTHKPRKPM
ncbi:hypothetical protein [Desulfofalx alkaliphila]|uniref:hypothetical protein n=1 Tax=Desulfofalx alkaliphila TaxID=105483 RepID=UPI0004E0EA91|nr:hypothetical protein [Desulfofalx alkaliphila]